MTVKEVYSRVLTELNKVQAPSLLLEDFVYFLNKAIQRYVNKRYNFFEMNQQLTDDLRVLTKAKEIQEIKDSKNKPTGEWELPSDYMHILNCVCTFTNNKGCDKEASISRGATKLDTAQLPHVIENYYMKPSYKRPYYYICYKEDPKLSKEYFNPDSLGVLDINSPISFQEHVRYGNSQIPVIQIKCGSATPSKVEITYLRTPKYVDLTVNELDDFQDTTPHLEFPDYVVFEIINELTTLILENNKDPRLQNQLPLSQTIVSPGMTQK